MRHVSDHLPTALESLIEEFRDIPDFPGYRVSSLGTVIGKRGKALRHFLCNRGGYPTVGLSCQGKPYTVPVHKLVLLAFHGSREPGKEACHLDGNPRNCSAENLVWGTPTENARHKFRHGTHPRGAMCSYTKFSPVTVLRVRKQSWEGRRLIEIAQDFPEMTYEHVRRIVVGKAWAHLPGVMPSRQSDRRQSILKREYSFFNRVLCRAYASQRSKEKSTATLPGFQKLGELLYSKRKDRINTSLLNTAVENCAELSAPCNPEGAGFMSSPPFPDPLRDFT